MSHLGEGTRGEQMTSELRGSPSYMPHASAFLLGSGVQASSECLGLIGGVVAGDCACTDQWKLRTWEQNTGTALHQYAMTTLM